MKKLFAFALAALLLVGSLATTVSAEVLNYDIPKAATAPTIDGVKNADEWSNALTIDMAASKLNFQADANHSIGENSKFYFMWDDAALYYFADVDDPSIPELVPPYGEALNTGDGIQFGIFSTEGGAAGAGDSHLFISCHPKTDNGQPDMFEHFNIAAQIAGDKGGKIASKFSTESAYAVEGSIPWSIFAEVYANGFTSEIKGVSGQQFLLACVIMDANGADQSLATNTGWFDSANTDTYKLTDAVAGAVAAPVTEAPVTEAAPAPEAPVAEEVAPAPEAPQTSDIALSVALLGLAAATAVIVVTKKKSK